MTDDKIMQVLRCCIADNSCPDCPAASAPYPNCIRNVSALALNRIIHQKAEIEDWKEAFDNLDKIPRPSVEYIENVKSEAITEFVKRLKNEKHIILPPYKLSCR